MIKWFDYAVIDLLAKFKFLKYQQNMKGKIYKNIEFSLYYKYLLVQYY